MPGQVDTTSELLVLAFGDAASPEVFTAKCSFAAGGRGLTMSAAFAERVLVPDCSAPAGAMITKRTIKNYDWSLEADGVCNAGDDKFFADWLKLGTAKNVKLSNGTTTGLVLAGSAVLSAFSVKGAGKGESIVISITLLANGASTHTAT